MAGSSVKEQIFHFTRACYSLQGTERQWLEEIAVAGRPFLDSGFGVAAWTFRRNAWTSDQLPTGIDRCLGEAMWSAAKRYSDAELVQLFMGPRATSATERLAIDHGLDENDGVGGGIPDVTSSRSDEFKRLGIKDFGAITVYDASGTGVALLGAAPQVLRHPRRKIARLERLGAHLLAGFRLRHALRDVDAVLEPSGRAVHAEGEARAPDHREALTRAVQAFDRVHSNRASLDADQSLREFEALVAGRWSIVQSFESDGRRYLLAMRNPPAGIEAAALSPVQAHALLLRAQGMAYQMIAYELGLADSVVFTLVQTGMIKLGIARETDIPLFFRAQACVALGKVRRIP